MKLQIAKLVVMLVISQGLVANELPPLELSKNSFWSVGLKGTQLNLKSGDGDHLLGTSHLVQFGHGYISDTFFWGGSLDIIDGPFKSSRQQDLVVDFSGSGFSAFAGFSAENLNLRTYQGNYGFLLGISYADIIGRSAGQRVSTIDGSVVDNWVMRVNNVSFTPSIFFCWLEPPRLKGNSPELLETRIEGFVLTLGLSAPIQTTYKLRFDQDQQPQTTRGSLRGYTIELGFMALFGV